MQAAERPAESTGRPKRGVLGQILYGAFVALVVGAVLSVLVRFLFPGVLESDATANAVGLALWIVAIALGFLEARRWR